MWGLNIIKPDGKEPKLVSLGEKKTSKLENVSQT